MASRTSRFRADETAANGREEAIHHFSRNFKKPEEREAATTYIEQMIKKYGPVVDGYPSWHPFVLNSRKDNSKGCAPETAPQGFDGLDHTIYFRDAFVTAPYGGAKSVIKSALDRKDGYVYAEEIDVALYFYKTTPVLITCEGIPKEADGTICKRFALGRMLCSELPAWEDAQCGESWEDMRRFLLGPPCGSRSSLFVNQETGQALREVWEILNKHELFGPVRTSLMKH